MEGNYTNLEFREKIFEDLKITKEEGFILLCSILIASVGLNMNSMAVIIGAMLISPLMTPILAMGYALSVFDFYLFKKAVKLLIFYIGVSLLTATLYFMISPISYASDEIIARTSPTIWDVIIAFAGGIAGIIGARKKESNNIVPGVAIATALMPPVCTIGYSISVGNVNYLIGSSLLFIINCAFIMIATFVGLRLLKVPVFYRTDDKQQKKLKRFLLALSIAIIIPSTISAIKLVKISYMQVGIDKLISEEFQDSIVLKHNFNKSENKLTIVISGPLLSAEKTKEIRESLDKYGLKNVNLDIEEIQGINQISQENFKKNYLNYLFEKDTNK